MRFNLFLTLLILRAFMCLGEQSQEIWAYGTRYQAIVGNYRIQYNFSGDRYVPYNSSGDSFTEVVPGRWDDALYQSHAKDYHLACGLAVKIQNNQGDKDDSSIIQITMVYCDVRSWGQMYEEAVNSFSETDFYDFKIICDPNEYIWAVKAQVQPDQGPGDDTALNGIMIYCGKIDETSASYRYSGYPVAMGQGKWSDQRVGKPMHLCVESR